MVRVSWVTGSRPSRAAARSVLTCTPMSSVSTGSGKEFAWSSLMRRQRTGSARVSSAALLAARHPTFDTTRVTRRASPRTPLATGPARSGTARSVRGSTTSHHAIGAGRWEARGWRSAYFSQPICGDDRSLCSPAPSPLVPRQWAPGANSLGNWRARQDSNLRPSA